MKSFIKYFQLWTTLTVNSFLVSLVSRFSVVLYLLGKILRFVFFLVFLLALFAKTDKLAGYSVMQMVFFFLTFNFVDTVTQLFFREVYRFRSLVASGDFDLVLVKPMNPLFRVLAGGADPFDCMMLVPYVGALIYVATQLGPFTPGHVLMYFLLLVNGFLIATGFHILVLALAVVTTEIDHAIMIYRDLTSMGRVPVDIYHEPLRSIVTFVLPVGLMMTFPAKGFLGLLTAPAVVGALVLGSIFFMACLGLWRYALTQYASASS